MLGYQNFYGRIFQSE